MTPREPIAVVEGMVIVRLPGWRCLRCHHEWVPRKPTTPKVCPTCKSPYWNLPRRAEVAS